MAYLRSSEFDIFILISLWSNIWIFLLFIKENVVKSSRLSFIIFNWEFIFKCSCVRANRKEQIPRAFSDKRKGIWGFWTYPLDTVRERIQLGKINLWRINFTNGYLKCFFSGVFWDRDGTYGYQLDLFLGVFRDLIFKKEVGHYNFFLVFYISTVWPCPEPWTQLIWPSLASCGQHQIRLCPCTLELILSFLAVCWPFISWSVPVLDSWHLA